MGSSHIQEMNMADDEIFAKKELQKLSCKVHNKKVRISCDYDNLGSNAYIEKYCCLEFAKEVEEVLAKMERFNKIEIEDFTNKKSR